MPDRKTRLANDMAAFREFMESHGAASAIAPLHRTLVARSPQEFPQHQRRTRRAKCSCCGAEMETQAHFCPGCYAEHGKRLAPKSEVDGMPSCSHWRRESNAYAARIGVSEERRRAFLEASRELAAELGQPEAPVTHLPDEDADFVAWSNSERRFKWPMVFTPEGVAVHYGEGCIGEGVRGICHHMREASD